MAAIEWTINVGQIIAICLALIGGLGIFYSLKERVSIIEEHLKDACDRLGRIEQKQRDLIEIYLPKLREMETRLEQLEER